MMSRAKSRAMSRTHARKLITAAGFALALAAGPAIAWQGQPEPTQDPKPPAQPPAEQTDQPEPDKKADEKADNKAEPQAKPEAETKPEAKPEAQSAPQPAPAAAPPAGDAPLPSLYELLGLPDEAAPAEDEAPLLDPEDPGAADLERRLTGEQLPGEIEAAVALMDDTADRMELSLDLGMTTQRMQEDIIRRLDQIIEAAAEQEQQSSSSSSSSGSQNQPNQQPSQPQSQQEGQRTPEHRASRAAWGALPERTRDALLQGSGERFSSMYQRMTEAYYRRLAEEAER